MPIYLRYYAEVALDTPKLFQVWVRFCSRSLPPRPKNPPSRLILIKQISYNRPVLTLFLRPNAHVPQPRLHLQQQVRQNLLPPTLHRGSLA